MSKNQKITRELVLYPQANSLEMLVRLMRVAFFTPGSTDFTPDGQPLQGQPMFIIGPPGEGKTAVVRQLIKSMTTDHPEGLALLAVEPGALGDAGVGVTPVPYTHKWGDGTEEMSMNFPVPKIFLQLDGAKRDRPGLLFVDEATTVQGATLPALLTMTQQGKIGDHYLNPRVRRFMAGNPQSMTGGEAFTAAHSNRLFSVRYGGSTFKELADYMAGMGTKSMTPLNVEATERLVASKFAVARAEWVGQVMQLLRADPAIRSKQPSDGSAEAQAPWPSSRAWEAVINMCATAAIVDKKPEELFHIIAHGLVGDEAAEKLRAQRIDIQLPPMDELISGKYKLQLEQSRFDVAHAIGNALRGYLANISKADKNILPRLMGNDAKPGTLRDVLSEFHRQNHADAIVAILGDLMEQESLTGSLAWLHQFRKTLNISGKANSR